MDISTSSYQRPSCKHDCVAMRPGIHLPLRERGQVVVTYAAQPHPFADEDRVAIAEGAGSIGEFGHVADTAACPTCRMIRSRPREDATSGQVLVQFPDHVGGGDVAVLEVAVRCR